MRIVIDLQACQSDSRFRGIGRYSNALSKAMARQSGKHEIFLALSDRFPETVPQIRADFDGLIPRERIITFSVPGRVKEIEPQNAWRTRAAEILREHFLLGLQPDIVHVSSLFEGWHQDVVTSIGTLKNGQKTAATLFDLIPYSHQTEYLFDEQIKGYYFRKIQSLKKADLLLSISEHSRQEAISNLGLDEDKIVNISSAVEPYFKPQEYSMQEKAAILARHYISKSYILCSPGGFDHRKNLNNLITAFSKMPITIRPKYHLVITGKTNEAELNKLINHARKSGIMGDEVIFTGFITDDDLIALYNLCDLFVFPSHYEGFGLPVLEAISCGAPVIGSNTTSIPDIVGWEAALFDPACPEEITKLMYLVLSDGDFKQKLIEQESKQLEKFSWENSAKNAIIAFELLHENKRLLSANVGKEKSNYYAAMISSLAEIKTRIGPTKIDLCKAASSIVFNTPLTGEQQILVDISVLVHGDAKGGIQRVVRSILLELLDNPPEGYRAEPIYFDGHRYRYATCFINEFLEDSAKIMIDNVIEITRGDIFLALDLHAHLTKSVHNFHKKLNVLGISLFYIVYDLLPIHHSEWWPEGTGEVVRQWFKSIAEVATGIICISQTVANEAKEWIEKNIHDREEPLLIGHFHLGADIKNSAPTTGMPDDASSVFAALETAPTFLMVGTLEPRKGHAQALSAFELLWEGGIEINLVIVGKRGWLVEKLIDRLKNHSMLGKRLFWLEGISDEYLEKVYSASTCLLAASEGEGFGLPLIEAAHKGLPILARDIPVFREVAGEHAFYFTATSSEALGEVINTWLKLFTKGKAPTSNDMPWLTWRESALQLLESMKIYSPEKCTIKHNTTNDNQEKSMIDNFNSLSLPLPNGVSEADLFEFITSIRVVDAPEDEMKSYATEDFRRFVYTWGLAKDISGKCLELGANPYFTTFLLKEFTNLELHLANYFGLETNGTQTQNVKYQDFETKRNLVKNISFQHFNVEKDTFPYSNGQFDLVIFSEIIEHLLFDPCFVLREINRVLKPGGYLIITTPNVARLENVTRLLDGVNIYDPYSGYGPYGRHNREYNRHELANLLTFESFELDTHFTADVHINHAYNYSKIHNVISLLNSRIPDLGQYIFMRAKKIGASPTKRPGWLYRSYSDAELDGKNE